MLTRIEMRSAIGEEKETRDAYLSKEEIITIHDTLCDRIEYIENRSNQKCRKPSTCFFVLGFVLLVVGIISIASQKRSFEAPAAFSFIGSFLMFSGGGMICYDYYKSSRSLFTLLMPEEQTLSYDILSSFKISYYDKSLHQLLTTLKELKSDFTVPHPREIAFLMGSHKKNAKNKKCVVHHAFFKNPSFDKNLIKTIFEFTRPKHTLIEDNAFDIDVAELKGIRTLSP